MPITDIEQFYNAQIERVYRYVYFRVQHAEVAEDIVSAVFEKAVKNAAKYTEREDASEASWVFQITRNTLKDYYKKHKSQAVDPAEIELEDSALQPDVRVEQMYDYQWMMQHIQQLPERQKEALMLRYQSGLKNTEIAELMHIDQKTVSATISQALKALRKTLDV